MLSRRNLRVKVMQVIYSLEHNPNDISYAKRLLQKNIEKAYSLLHFDLSLIVRVAQQLKKEQQMRLAKLLPTSEDKDFSIKLSQNPFIEKISNERKIRDVLKLQMTEDEQLLVKDIYKNLSESAEYKRYANKPESNIEEQREMLLYLLNEVILKNEQYEHFIEDNFPECISEVSKVNFFLNEKLKALSAKGESNITAAFQVDNDENFALELLSKTLQNNERFTKLIEPKLKNWDMDRIARMDMILMKMALCELLFFDQIPVKVSINEYIDISKIYSTPRSKDFINGILDNIMHELRAENQIKKSGRGLME